MQVVEEGLAPLLAKVHLCPLASWLIGYLAPLAPLLSGSFNYWLLGSLAPLLLCSLAPLISLILGSLSHWLLGSFDPLILGSLAPQLPSFWPHCFIAPCLIGIFAHWPNSWTL